MACVWIFMSSRGDTSIPDSHGEGVDIFLVNCMVKQIDRVDDHVVE